MGKHAQSGSKKRKRAAPAQDDTPKEFKRLLARQSGDKLKSGLDEGTRPPTKKEKPSADSKTSKSPATEVKEALKIMPGEKFSDFAARVDHSLPIAGLRRRTVKVQGIKERQTKAEKKMHRIQKEWRDEEAKRKEKEEEARDLADEEDAEDWNASAAQPESKRGKKGKKAMDEDLWADLKLSRTKPGLNDVAQEPPTFKRVPREVFKVKHGAKIDVANVPTASGSLRRREELGEARKNIIEQYRKMMAGKKDS